MEWLFGGNSEAAQRKRAIDAFKAAHRNAIPDATGNNFELSVRTAYGDLRFQVIIGPQFPTQPPVIHLLTRASHPWLDADMNVKHRMLLPGMWSPHNSLAQIVSDTIAEFSVRPPMPIITPKPGQAQHSPHNAHSGMGGMPGAFGGSHFGAQQQPPAYIIPPSNQHMGVVAPPAYQAGSGMGASASSPVASQQAAATAALQAQQLKLLQQQQGQYQSEQEALLQAQAQSLQEKQRAPAVVQPPAQPEFEVPHSEFPELDSYTISQLEDMAQNPQLLDDIVNHNDAVKAKTRICDQLYRDIEEIATKTLSRQDEFAALRTSVRTLAEQTAQKQATLDALVKRQQAYMERYSLANVRAALQSSVDEANESSDALRHHFRDQAANAPSGAGPSVHEFLKQYIKARQTVHLRTACLDRLEQSFSAD